MLRNVYLFVPGRVESQIFISIHPVHPVHMLLAIIAMDGMYAGFAVTWM